METDCVVAGDAIAIRNGSFWQTLPRRLERRIRTIFSAPGDMHAPVARNLTDAPARLDRVTVETPNGARRLYCRKGTSDEGVVWSAGATTICRGCAGLRKSANGSKRATATGAAH
jgi:hypothetical protein